MSPIRVFVFGATGQTAQMIVDGLVKSPTDFEITAVGRPSSVDKPENVEFKKKGIKVVGIDVAETQRRELVELLKDADAVLAPIFFTSTDQAKLLIDACKEAGVKRFVPNTFQPVMPATGVMGMREKKEEVVSYLKLQKVPYTIIDVAWWYQNLPYKVPSGRTDYTVGPPMDDPRIWGDGNQPIAFSSIHSIGPHVAKIIADPRTINNYVHVWDQVLTLHQVIEALEELSGEKVEKNYWTKKELEETIAKAKATLASDPDNEDASMNRTCAEYFYSMGVRGDSTLESAKSLGYLDSRELYPDLEQRTVKDHYKEVLGGKAFVPYSG